MQTDGRLTIPQTGWTETQPGSGVFQCDRCGLQVPMRPHEWPIRHKCPAPACEARGAETRTVRQRGECRRTAEVPVFACARWGECTLHPTAGTLLVSCDECDR